MKTLDKTLMVLLLVAAGCGQEKHKKPARPPSAPTELSQSYKDLSTRLAWGGLTGEDAVVLRARVSSSDSTHSVRLHVEVAPGGTPFSGQPTATSPYVTSGEFAVAYAPLTQEGPYTWQAWTEDSIGLSSGVTNPPAGTAFTRDSFVPTEPSQCRFGGSTPIPVGEQTPELGVDLSARVHSLAGNMVRAQVEVKPLATPFDGGDLQLGRFVASGERSRAVVLLPPGDYHWRLRAEDVAGATSSWLAFGGNDDLEPEPADFSRTTPADVIAPAPPVGLQQYHTDSVSVIPPGDGTSEDKVVLTALVTPTSSMAAVEVEVKGFQQAFDGLNTVIGSFDWSSLSRAVVPLAPGSWHWRARTLDAQGASSDWASFSGAAFSTDFSVLAPVNHPPNEPTSLRQYQANGWQGIAPGESLISSSMIMKADVSDPDLGNGLVLEVEVKPFGLPFANVPSAASAILTNGSTAVIQLYGLSPGVAYHWQARTIDQDGAMSAWVESLNATISSTPPPTGGSGGGGGGGGGGCGGSIVAPPGIGILLPGLIVAVLACRPRRAYFRRASRSSAAVSSR
jgi:hypothetical protein